MVHKSSHHFDLVNWWLGDEPRDVFGYGRLGFYGRAAGERHGLRRDYERAHGADQAAGDPFALDLSADDTLRALYPDAERDDGYVRDRIVFGGPVTIEDDMAVLVRCTGGATMTHHLTAYSPSEGCRVMFNGSAGRLELEVEESRWQRPTTRIGSAGGALHGDTAAEHAGGARLTLRPLWRAPLDIPLVTGSPESGRRGRAGGSGPGPVGLVDQLEHRLAPDRVLRRGQPDPVAAVDADGRAHDPAAHDEPLGHLYERDIARGGGVAVHDRGVADRPDAFAALRPQLAALADRTQQAVVRGGAAPRTALEDDGLRVGRRAVENTRPGADGLTSNAS